MHNVPHETHSPIPEMRVSVIPLPLMPLDQVCMQKHNVALWVMVSQRVPTNLCRRLCHKPNFCCHVLHQVVGCTQGLPGKAKGVLVTKEHLVIKWVLLVEKPCKVDGFPVHTFIDHQLPRLKFTLAKAGHIHDLVYRVAVMKGECA